MARMQKFTFDRAFDDDSATGDLDAPRPVYTEDDMAKRLAESRKEGHVAGFAAAVESEERRIAELLVAAGERIDALTAAQVRHNDEIARGAVEVAMNVARKILPATAQTNALGEVEGVLRECLAMMFDEPRVVLRVAEALVDPIRKRLDLVSAGAGYQGKLVLMIDDALGPSECAVQWADGGADRDLKRLWAEIDATLKTFLERAAPRDGDGEQQQRESDESGADDG